MLIVFYQLIKFLLHHKFKVKTFPIIWEIVQTIMAAVNFSLMWEQTLIIVLNKTFNTLFKLFHKTLVRIHRLLF